ncbi:MAG TPA: F0F1 ATP synthase subunit epsilon [Anaerolineae bacterium]|nr:F0F1 ATP synthase subunit epsilon [Anaerolineae bacterium]
MSLRCDIVTQERLVFSAEVDSVNIPGSEGRMGVLSNHSPMLTTLGFGEVIVRQNGEEAYFAIGGGFAEIQADHIIILADSAENAAEIDLERAVAARQSAEQLMKEGVPEDPDTYAQIRKSLLRAQVRLDVGKRRRRSGITQFGSRQEDND